MYEGMKESPNQHVKNCPCYATSPLHLSYSNPSSPPLQNPHHPHPKSAVLGSMNGALWCFSVTAANVFTSIWSVGKAANWVSVFPGHQEVSLSINTESQAKASTDVVSHPLPSRFRPASGSRCNLLCLKPQSKIFPSLSPHHSSKTTFYHSPGHWGKVKLIFVHCSSLDCVHCVAIGTTGVMMTWTRCYFVCTPSRPDRSKWCYFPCASLHKWQDLWGLGFVYLLIVEFTFPLLHKDSKTTSCRQH